MEDMLEKRNYIDEDFDNLVDYVKKRNYQEIFSDIKHNFEYYKATNNILFNNVCDFYNKHMLWGSINLDKNDFNLIENNTNSLINHIDDYKWFYDNLNDYRSKKILCSILYYWITLNDKKVQILKDDFYSQYFDLDLIKCDKSEVFVDIGSYTGDTIWEYIKNYSATNYKKIYCYEIVPTNIKYLKENIKRLNLKNVIIKEKGVSNQNIKMYINDDEVSSIIKLDEKGAIEIETVKIDKDIKGPITFIKMDIEGDELKALEGMKNKIRKYKPKLAICVYHNNDHLWKIPKLIYELNPHYKFYLRYYGGPILPTEYVLYAI